MNNLLIPMALNSDWVNSGETVTVSVASPEPYRITQIISCTDNFLITSIIIGENEQLLSGKMNSSAFMEGNCVKLYLKKARKEDIISMTVTNLNEFELKFNAVFVGEVEYEDIIP